MQTQQKKPLSFYRQPVFRLTCVALLAVIAALSAFFMTRSSEQYARIVRESGAAVSCKYRKGVLYLTAETSPDSVVSLREALSALRNEDCVPDAVTWCVGENTPENCHTILRGGYRLPAATARMETLDAQMTELKVKYELQQLLLSARVSAEDSGGGKKLKITVETTPEELLRAAAVLRTVVLSVNEEGGGIIRCDAMFTQNDVPFAALSEDLIYGDVIYTPALTGIEEN